MLTASLLLTPTVSAEEVLDLAPTEGFTFSPGYDWSARVNQTHILAPVTGSLTVVHAEDLDTPYIDLELTGLMPLRAYRLILGTFNHAVYANSAGEGIAWSIYGESGTWILLDTITNEPWTMVQVVAPVSAGVGVNLCGPPGPVCPNPQPTYYYPPQPNGHGLFEDGLAIEQGAYSYTPLVRIRTTSCIDHDIKVSAKASGGRAAFSGTAGGDYSYRDRVCIEVVSRGKPSEYKGGVSVREDRYEDGSKKWYVFERNLGFDHGDVDVYYAPRGTLVSLGPFIEGGYAEYFERQAGGVIFRGGVKLPNGVELSVEFQASGGSDSKVRFEFLPMEEKKKFYFLLVNGGGTYPPHGTNEKGLIGMIWPA